MSPDKLNKIVRLLKMQSSHFDSEAASALRLATALADEEGGWEAVLSGGDAGRRLAVATDLKRRLNQARAASPEHWPAPTTDPRKSTTAPVSPISAMTGSGNSSSVWPAGAGH